jgi:hypothetical protein
MSNIKENIESNVLADVLFSKFIMNKDLNSRFKLDTKWELSPYSEDKVWLYKLALVLLGILALEDNNSNFKDVRETLEKLVFSAHIVEGMPIFLEVKKAMDELSKLLFSLRNNAGQWMFWALSWLKEIGIIETNPIRLFQFACMWVDDYVMIVDYLKEWNPQ